MIDTLSTLAPATFGPNVRLELESDVAVVLVDNPPINVSSRDVRGGLLAAFESLTKEPGRCRAVVLMGAGKSFVSGSDLREFDQALPEPELPIVISAIEACPLPVVAAIHGAALGGGFELALGCDWRVAVDAAVVGLPEVQLGLIPGAGGTQRLPRLVGMATATEMITSGRRVPAAEAHAAGAIDALAEHPLRTFAVDFARAHASDGKRPVAAMAVATSADETAPEATAPRRSEPRPCIAAAVEAIQNARTLPFSEGLRRERRTFQQLRGSEEARALRYGFFSERAAAKHPELDGIAVEAITTLGIVGAGTMGADIAALAAGRGLRVRLADSDPAALLRARAAIDTTLAGMHRAGKLGGRNPAECLDAIALADDLDTLAATDLIVEAVFEDFGVKCDVLTRLVAITRPEVVIASNTSYIDLDRLAAASGAGERMIGLHFFAPATRMRLLEVVAAHRARPQALANGIAFAKQLGKLPILAGPSEGFIGNRIFARYREQGEYAVEDGAAPHEVDAAARSLGFAMGPFEVADLSGLDIAWRYRRSHDETRDPRRRYVRIADELYELGRLGRKSGAGWYDYDAAGNPVPSSRVAELIAKHANFRGSVPPLSRQLQERLLGAIVNEAAWVVAEHVARTAAEIDLVLVNGYGYSRYKGGPLFQAARMRPDEVEAMVDAAQAATGFGFRRADANALLAPLRRS